jgi:TRAP-type uncharacterized transport system fused permease subunit
MLAAALSKYFLVEMKRWEQYLCFAGAICLIAPNMTSAAIGVALVLPMLIRQVLARQKKLA